MTAIMQPATPGTTPANTPGTSPVRGFERSELRPASEQRSVSGDNTLRLRSGVLGQAPPGLWSVVCSGARLLGGRLRLVLVVGLIFRTSLRGRRVRGCSRGG